MISRVKETITIFDNFNELIAQDMTVATQENTTENKNVYDATLCRGIKQEFIEVKLTAVDEQKCAQATLTPAGADSVNVASGSLNRELEGTDPGTGPAVVHHMDSHGRANQEITGVAKREYYIAGQSNDAVLCRRVSKESVEDKPGAFTDSNFFNEKTKPRLHFELYSCDKCVQTFSSKVTFMQHYRLAHLTELNEQNEFNEEYLWKSYFHKHTSHYGTLLYECAICKKIYKSTRGLRDHVLRHHKPRYVDSEPNIYICDYCQKTCARKSNIERHITRVHASRSYKYKCNQCEESYENKKYLKKHVTDSHIPLMHTCHVCSRTFIQMRNLKRHVLIMHSDTKLQCKVCSENMMSTEHLQHHMKDIHGQQSTGIMESSYKRKIYGTNVDQTDVASAISDVLEGRLSVRRAANKYNLKPGTLHWRIMQKKAFSGTMACSDKRTTFRTNIRESDVESAMSDVLEGRLTIKRAANKYNIHPSSLQRRIMKKKAFLGGSDKKMTSRTKVDENDVASAISDVLEGKLSMRRAADKYSLKLGTLKFRLKKKKAFLGTMEHSSNIDERAVASAISDVLEGRLTMSRAAAKYNLKHGTLHYRIMKKKALLGIMDSSDKKKTPRTKLDENVVATAVSEVLEGRLSIRKAAVKYNLKLTTLTSRVKKRKEVSENNQRSPCSKFREGSGESTQPPVCDLNAAATSASTQQQDVVVKKEEPADEELDLGPVVFQQMQYSSQLQDVVVKKEEPADEELNLGPVVFQHMKCSSQQQDVVVKKEDSADEELDLGPVVFQHMDSNYRPYKV